MVYKSGAKEHLEAPGATRVWCCGQDTRPAGHSRGSLSPTPAGAGGDAAVVKTPVGPSGGRQPLHTGHPGRPGRLLALDTCPPHAPYTLLRPDGA